MKNSKVELVRAVGVQVLQSESDFYDLLETVQNGTYIEVKITGINFINISLGARASNKIMKYIYEEIQLIRKGIIVSRISFNRFGIYTDEIDTQNIKESIKDIFKIIYCSTINKYDVKISTNIAAVIYTNNDFNMIDILNKIDISMQNAIKKGSNKYEIYNERYPVNITIDTIEKALENSDIVLYYQPKIELQNETIQGVEALIRWFDKDYGYITPETLIRFAEDSGYINKLGEWITRQACKDIKKINENLLEKIHLSINISPYQLEDDKFLDRLKLIIQEVGFDEELLKLEITENRNIEYINKINCKLDKIKKLGIKVSIDDFGKGHTSISHIKNYYADEIKIDKSLVEYIRYNPIFIKNLINMVHTTNAIIVAEGVERKLEYEMLKAMGCDLVQGYYCYRPMSFEKLLQLIK